MTPDFPSFEGGFATQIHRLRTTTGSALHQLELLLNPWIPSFRLAQQDEGAHSRDRVWNLRLVFWTFLWQITQVGSSCREAIRQAQSLCQFDGRPIPPDAGSPYCQARGSLPVDRLQEIHDAIAREAEQAVAVKDFWCSHRVYAVDGTTVTMPDTPANQAAYPQLKCQKPGCGFPILRLLAFFNLATGMLTSWLTGPWLKSEARLLQCLWEHLRPGDVLLADRGFSRWAVLAECFRRQIHGVIRWDSWRRPDFRRGKRLSKNERLIRWFKPRTCAASLTAEQWAALPEYLDVRLVRCRMGLPGFRTRQVLLVTTLLDPVKYTAESLGKLYLRRWSMELTLRHLKTTLQMEHLSCKNPENIERELRMHLLVHNLGRRLMLEAARRERAPLDRVSFAGALALMRRYGEALLRARNKRQRQKLMDELYRVLAADLNPDRPGRREPRAIKRRPKPFPLLRNHRSRFMEVPHKSYYWKRSQTKAAFRKSRS